MEGKAAMTMSNPPASQDIKPRRLKLVFIWLAAICAGLFFLARADTDWQQTLDSLTQSSSHEPAKLVSLPPQTSAVLPSFDAVSADEGGMLIAAGKGPEGAAIVLRNGSQTLAKTRSDENGEWVLMLDNPLAAGEYVLSLQAVDPATQQIVDGRRTFALKIAPRGKGLRTQLEAAIPQNAGRPAQSTAGAGPNPKVTAVKRGDTLWDIARRHYGDATRYPEIVDANKPQIKNPNLIFPNQQFEIPHQ
jgi:nucleoid-associated protein YgaU